MGLLDYFKPNLKANPSPKENTDGESVMNYFAPPQNDIFKANIPNFLYKPPFGYPRKINIPHLRDIAKTPYVFGVIKTLSDEAAGTPWEVRVKEEFAEDTEAQSLAEEATLFLKNPNGNDESFELIQKAVIKDILELDSGILVKVFNPDGKLSQIFARDGGSFLKNPDIYGYMGQREDFIFPSEQTLEDKEYSEKYSNAAYFQYGWTTGGKPIPFGKREVMFIVHNPKTDSIYGTAPMEILTNTLYMLIYGQQYNLDYYMNGNLPDGIVHLPNADKKTAQSFAQRLMAKFKKVDDLSNKTRVGHQYPIWAGEQAPNFIPFMMSTKDMQILEQQKWFIKLVWSVFGVTPDEMGFTEDSNRATAISQLDVHKRKAVQPILETLSYHYTTQILTEFDPMGRLEFVFDDYDINTEMQRMDLHQKNLDLGIKTPEMIAKEEGIDVEELKQSKKDSISEAQDNMDNSSMTKEETDEKDMTKEQTSKEPKVKAFAYNIGDHAKIMKDNPGYTGLVGVISEINFNKNNEYVYTIKFDDTSFIRVFAEEIKCIEPYRTVEEDIEEVDEVAYEKEDMKDE